MTQNMSFSLFTAAIGLGHLRQTPTQLSLVREVVTFVSHEVTEHLSLITTAAMAEATGSSSVAFFIGMGGWESSCCPCKLDCELSSSKDSSARCSHTASHLVGFTPLGDLCLIHNTSLKHSRGGWLSKWQDHITWKGRTVKQVMRNLRLSGDTLLDLFKSSCTKNIKSQIHCP